MVGAFVALAVSRMLTSLLYGVGAVDLSSFLIASGLMAALVAALGAWIPARRAVSADLAGACVVRERTPCRSSSPDSIRCPTGFAVVDHGSRAAPVLTAV